ncbi:general transcription repressor [Lambiella insularis]|nr:general transcription repressor [Lambiella insularis]
MYNAHRGMVAAPSSRLTELLDQVRVEFDNQQNRTAEYDQQSSLANTITTIPRVLCPESIPVAEAAYDMLPCPDIANSGTPSDQIENSKWRPILSAQMQEMEMVRQKVYSLEQTQIAIKQRYDEEIARLRHELEARGGPPAHMGVLSHSGAPHPQPPNIGNGQPTLFGGIMANPPGQGGPALAPPSQDQHQQGPPQHQMPQPPPGPQQPQQNFGGYQQPSLANGGYNTQAPQPTASPGPGKVRPGRGPAGPVTTQQNQHGGYPDRGSPQIPRPTPPPQQAQIRDVGNVLAELDPAVLGPHQKREGEDWFAVFNPRVQRVLDVDLVHTLTHESVVCCVRFSHDGRYVATGCNRSAQIFEVSSGRQVQCLQDDTVDKDGDLYIRSVCFSPDGKYLATGAEDKLIRVWDIATNKIRHTFAGHDQDIYSLDFARNGKHIASGSGDRSVRIWDIDSGREIINLQIEDGVTTVAMSPDGQYVAAGSLDKSVRVWETRSGLIHERLDGAEGHKDSVYSVAFAPNGRELVSGSLDKTIKMWEIPEHRQMVGHPPRAGKCVRTFEGHKASTPNVKEKGRAITDMSRRTSCSVSHSRQMVRGC